MVFPFPVSIPYLTIASLKNNPWVALVGVGPMCVVCCMHLRADFWFQVLVAEFLDTSGRFYKYCRRGRYRLVPSCLVL